MTFCYSLTCDYELSVFRSSRVLLIASEVHDNSEEKLKHSRYASILKIRGSETDRDLKPSNKSQNGLKNHTSLTWFSSFPTHGLPSSVYYLIDARAPLEDFMSARNVE